MAYAVKGKGKVIARKRRHQRVRKHMFGSAERPRLAVFRSNRHIVAQLIDDNAGRTLAAASSLEKEIAAVEGKKVDVSRKVGEVLAARAKNAGISAVVFDRGGYKYHGRVAAVADGARDGGLTL